MELKRYTALAFGCADQPENYVQGGYAYCKEDDTHYITRVELLESGVHLPCFLRVEPTTIKRID